MSLPTTVLQKMLDKGLTLADAVEIAQAWDEGAAQPVAVYDARAAKRAADRDRMRAKREAEAVARQSRDVACDVAEIPLSPALSPQTPQTHPHTREVSTTRGKRGSRRVFGEWLPSAKTLEALESEGFSSGDLERALTRMRDHEFKTPRTDWDATFRNWVRADADRKPSTRNVKPYADQRQAAREDSLRAHQSGAMAALNRRLG